MPIRGIGTTYVGSIASAGALIPVDVPDVEIILPDLSSVVEQEEYYILFVWDDAVSNFMLSDIVPSGNISVTDLDEIDPTTYSALLTLPSDTAGSATITVSAHSVNAAGGTAPRLDKTELFAFNTTGVDDGLTLLCSRFRNLSMTDLDNVLLDGERSGGAYSGIMEAVEMGDYIYFVVQVQKRDEVLLGTRYQKVLGFLYRLYRRQAGAVLFRLNTTTCIFDIIKAYPSITLAARSLRVWRGVLYYFEGSHYAYLNEGEATRGTDDDNQVQYLQRRLLGVPEDWKEQIGHLYALVNPTPQEPDPTPVDLGLNYASALPSASQQGRDRLYGTHGGTASPLVVDDEGLTMITGYGNLDTIDDVESDVSKYANWHQVRRGTQLDFLMPVIETNDRSGYDILKELATAMNCVFGIDRGRLFFRPRVAFSAEWSMFNDPQLLLESLNRVHADYDASGLVAVGNELIRYDTFTGVSPTTATVNVTERGAHGTPTQTHSQYDPIHWVDHFLGLNQQTLDMPINDVSAVEDKTNIFNRIVVRYGSVDPFVAEDAASIAIYGVREFGVNVPLGIANVKWAEWIAEGILNRFKTPNSIINLQLQPSWHLKTGQIVFVQIKDRLHLEAPTQIVSVTHSVETDEQESRIGTNVQLLTL